MVDRTFLKRAHREFVLVEEDPSALLKAFEVYEPPRTIKWIDDSERRALSKGSDQPLRR